MLGGNGSGKFYVTEINRIEGEHKANLPPGGYTPQQIQAGYDRLGKTFGFYRTLLFMEKQTPYKRHELLNWTVAEFMFNLRYISWENETEKKYKEIMSK